jgi:two-component system LytT family sensor kinase
LKPDRLSIKLLYGNLDNMALKRYSKKEPQIFLWVMLPYTSGLNAIIFGKCVLESLKLFVQSFFLSAIYLFIVYFVFGLVAVQVKKRFPANSDLFRRIGTMLPIFYVMNILLVTGLYAYHNLIKALPCEPNNQLFWWALVYCCIASTVITFLNEATSNWQSWKASVTETEQLKNAYQKSKLLGLKGQVNPHFLFNCFNSLSSLINDDEAEAEVFLNEMTKVHRYMLRGDDEQLVPLQEELKFVESYLYLTHARFGDAIQSNIEVTLKSRQELIPPLSLQVILENIIYSNTASKSEPLCISICCEDDHRLVIRNTVNLKTRKLDTEWEEGLDNLIKKYKLLNEPDVKIVESATEREIMLPLIIKKEEEVK